MIDATEPTAGFFRTRFVRGGPPIGVRIFYGPPRDPETNEEMDRSWRWQAEVNGRVIEHLDRVWPGCAGEAIDEAEYRFMMRAHQHAAAHDAYSPLAQPRKRVDWDTASPPLFS